MFDAFVLGQTNIVTMAKKTPLDDKYPVEEAMLVSLANFLLWIKWVHTFYHNSWPIIS